MKHKGWKRPISSSLPLPCQQPVGCISLSQVMGLPLFLWEQSSHPQLASGTLHPMVRASRCIARGQGWDEVLEAKHRLSRLIYYFFKVTTKISGRLIPRLGNFTVLAENNQYFLFWCPALCCLCWFNFTDPKTQK